MFCFTVKLPSVTQRSVSQENAFEKSKISSFFFRKTIGLRSNNSFILIEHNFRLVFEKEIFEFKVGPNSLAYGQNAPSWDPSKHN